MKKQSLALILAMLLSVGAVGAAYAEEKAETEKNTFEQANEKLNEINEHWQQIGEEYAPEIRTLKNGVKVQRTPSEFRCYHWSKPYEKGKSYNNYFLDADHRGCNACHYDLGETLKNMDYAHPTVWNDDLGNWVTIGQCYLCHGCDGDGGMGTQFHAVHYNTRNRKKFEAMGGNCMSCHNFSESIDGSEKTVQLWDLVKYDKMVGIQKVKDVQGEFTFTQDKVQNNAEMFTYEWNHSYWQHIRYVMGKHGDDTMFPQDMIDNWEFSVHGEVNEPFTMTRKELIEEAEAAGVTVTKVSKIHCVDNMPGGAGISNVEITGIPLTWVLEKAGGVKDNATGVVFEYPGEPGDYSTRGAEKGKYDKAYIVYKIGGEELTPAQGSPLMIWYEGADAQSFVKSCVGIRATDEELRWGSNTGYGMIMNGWNFYSSGDWINKPNATILNCPEGKIIQTGKPYTFEGYADAYDEKIASIEFSMDRGKTWTKFDLPDTDPNKVLFWEFTWTPETDASYVLTIRATTENGLVSPTSFAGYHCVMVTARSDAEELYNEDK